MPHRTTQSIYRAKDGCRLAFDVTGDGPPLVLLHGAGYRRQDWHDVGYVERLACDFRVLNIDLRGNGDSDKPETPESYTIGALTSDVVGVADACGISSFMLWGFSFGANVGRYLTAHGDRVSRFIMGGIPWGSATPGAWGKGVRSLVEKWRPILAARRAGTLDPNTNALP